MRLNKFRRDISALTHDRKVSQLIKLAANNGMSSYVHRGQLYVRVDGTESVRINTMRDLVRVIEGTKENE